ncbi:MAG: DUF937 domain-containing protein [marine benthic group bacterium]|jgi:hypothetical protein|nr:DUF937 domain-containing protein [Gemmatimonadota bacterium]
MSELYRSIMAEVAGQVGEIASELGTDEDTAAGAIGTAVPLMIGGLSRLASSSDEGALALFDALEEEEEEEEKGFFGNMASLLTSPLALAAGGMMVNKMFGGRKGPIEAGLSAAFGLGRKQSGNLFLALTPMVLGTLRRHKREKRLDSAGVADLLRREEKQIREDSKELDGLLGVFDRDDDGGVLDDVAKMGAAVVGAGIVARMFKRD